MSDRKIQEAISILAGTHKVDRVSAITAEVISINASARNCVCRQINGLASAEINDVLLMATADDGILIIPQIGSTVNIILSDRTEPYISQYSGVERIIFLGGDLGGMVMIKPLLDKINSLENIVNGLIKKFNVHTHNVTAIGAPTGPNILQETETLFLTQLIDLENKNVTHG